MSNETLYTDMNTAFVVRDGETEIGLVWYEPDTEWNAHHNDSDLGWDFIDSFEDAVESLTKEENRRAQ